MKLLSFKYKDKSSFGLLDGQNVIDLGNHFGSEIKCLKELLKNEKFFFERLNLNKFICFDIFFISFFFSFLCLI